MQETKILDYEGVMERLDNDSELLKELFGLFFEGYNEARDGLRDAVHASNARHVHERAHAIKSALGNLGAMRCHQLAFELEKAGKAEQLSNAASLLAQLESEIEAYRSAFQRQFA